MIGVFVTQRVTMCRGRPGTDQGTGWNGASAEFRIPRGRVLAVQGPAVDLRRREPAREVVLGPGAPLADVVDQVLADRVEGGRVAALLDDVAMELLGELLDAGLQRRCDPWREGLADEPARPGVVRRGDPDEVASGRACGPALALGDEVVHVIGEGPVVTRNPYRFPVPEDFPDL
ncbi:hypothetical protein GCM10010415_75120 [Streptomyces atrovirens]|uniref:Uncharacterized protein n=1 Tax=Streptomyces atrovirens TaxID=285556 RepID=A0ABW0DJE3_9ACTN